MRQILLVGPSWVGDMVMAQSLLMVLRQQQPMCQIDVLAPQWSEGLLQRMPEVRQTWTHDLAHGRFGWSERRMWGKKLQSVVYQQAIVLPNSWKSALIPFWAKIPQRTGYLGEWRYGLLNDVYHLDKTRTPRTVEQFVALAGVETATLPYPRLHPHAADAALSRLQLAYDPTRPLLALAAGAEYGEAKRWPAEYFAIVAKTYAQQKNGQVWLFGSQKDAASAQIIVKQANHPHVINLCGRTHLTEAVDLLALAQVVISNDSGLMHLAAALDRRLIALFGSSDPKMTPPLHPQATVISLSLPCSPCFKRQCPLQHLRCLRDLSPERVLAELFV
ncbi:lipopolysaccharide heptosyltransferase II [Thioflexithrix psekupsensis]|uniref:lipopolysaccharide heptosyltransferase II n=1 Tax=Thioflexithrix psekupsensis TaxID=1570016 RepID=UPI001C3DEB77|nr:lipopolysaccharide heptosyltransferase II [Thioflexithrix psekupsensis]